MALVHGFVIIHVIKLDMKNIYTRLFVYRCSNDHACYKHDLHLTLGLFDVLIMWKPTNNTLRDKNYYLSFRVFTPKKLLIHKRFIILSVISFLMLSCVNEITPVTRGEKITTVEILENVVDTLPISITNDKLYVIKDGVVLYETTRVEPNQIIITDGGLTLMIVVLFVLFMFLLFAISNQ